MTERDAFSFHDGQSALFHCSDGGGGHKRRQRSETDRLAAHSGQTALAPSLLQYAQINVFVTPAPERGSKILCTLSYTRAYSGIGGHIHMQCHQTSPCFPEPARRSSASAPPAVQAESPAHKRGVEEGGRRISRNKSPVFHLRDLRASRPGRETRYFGFSIRYSYFKSVN